MAAIVGIVTGLVGPSIELGKCIAAPIKKQFNYLFCFSNNIQSLKDEALKLEHERLRVQMKVDAANRNVEVILPAVETWLTSVESDQAIIKEIESKNRNVRSGVFNLKARYSLSREAKKTADVLKGRIDDSRWFEQVSNPALPASMGSILSRTTEDFESRKHVEERIMAALRDQNVNMIGICGMGGVRKTTMAKRIMNTVREEKMFDEVVMAVVSQQADISKIQQQIADNLGLSLGVEALSARADRLRTRLTGTKRVLIVLDDVWDNLKLEELGIPYEGGFERCKILLTSRDQDVLSGMEAHKVIDIEVLTKEEAWLLFRERAGHCVNHQDLQSTAEAVAKECKGLPVALITVGRALKDKKKSVWDDALLQLSKSNPRDLPNVLKEVYNPLKLSYDFLESEHAKSLFLLCSMFAEDFNIPLEVLTRYVMGLHLFEETLNLEQVTNRMCTLVDMLKSRSLLQNGDKKDRVKMHDVVRDMAIYIASNEDLGFVIYPNDRSLDLPTKNSFEWISMISKKKIELPTGLHFPNLQLLMVRNMKLSDMGSLDNFFQGMKNLNVVSFQNMLIGSLPQSINFLTNLQTLRLDSCEPLANIAVVGDLTSLEILSCCNCTRILELPVDIGKLSHLRLLELYSCANLRSIAPGVISKLTRLEGLKIQRSFSGWEGKEDREGRRNASLTELECLQKLSWLEIEISDINLSKIDICLSSNIVRYDIAIPSYMLRRPEIEDFKNNICLLHLSSEVRLGNWIRTFLRSAKCLNLEGDGLNRLNLAELKNVEFLLILGCSTMNKLVNDKDWRCDIFPVLKSLILDRLPNIEEICSGSIPVESNLFGNFSVENVSFHNLRFITISDCYKLRNLVPLSLARNLSQLEILKIYNCPAMEEVFTNDQRGGQEIRSGHVPVESNLRNLSVENVSFCNLIHINIWYCHKLRNLFSVSTARGLSQLEILNISECPAMEEVFTNDERDGQGDVAFPKLKELTLDNLPRLTTFCQGVERIEFPQIIKMKLGNLSPRIFSSTKTQLNWAGHKDNLFHIFCHQKVFTLKRLTLKSVATNIWCPQIPTGFFKQLVELNIEGYMSSSLFSSSIFANLVNLVFLRVGMSSEMVTVISEEEQASENSLLIPSLKELILESLTKLRSFYQGKHDIKLPSLNTVRISYCRQMETFSMGSLSTENLKAIRIHWKQIETKDLNVAVQQYHLKSKEDEDEDEDQETESAD